MEKLYVTRTSLPPFEEYCAEIRDLWDSALITNMGVKHQRLQQELETFLEGPLTLFTNGHLALESVLEALELPKGSEVITTPFTFVSTVHAIVRKGLVPVFCDVLEADGTLDPEKAEALVTESTAAILPVHVYGHPCRVEQLEALSRKHGIKLIYDAAHAFGVRYKGTPLVRYGDASILSFHATKVFSTIEGGAVCFADERLRQHLEDLANFGIRDTEHCERVGGNAKMNEFQAAMGLCNLRHFQEEIGRRKAAYTLYRELLPPEVRLLEPREGTEPNYAYCPVVFGSREQRDKACEALLRQGIHPRKYFYPLVSDFPPYRSCAGDGTPAARSLSARILCLPLSASLSPAEVERICLSLRENL